jgi:hypothetical protein
MPPTVHASRAPWTASPGRSRVFDGMHALYEHSPPMSSRSTTATRRPLGQGARTLLTRRPGAEHDHGIFVVHLGSFLVRALPGQVQTPLLVEAVFAVFAERHDHKAGWTGVVVLPGSLSTSFGG